MKNQAPRLTSLTLGMLAAFGPFVTDFYLPVLPQMATHFHTSPSLISMSLTMGMIGLAGGQICIGPLTDKYGRKHILVASMLLFTAASLLCIFSSNILIFNIARLFQGIAGAGGIVISKSMATDMFFGSNLTRFMVMLAAVNAVAPICAPVLGGAVSVVTNWQGIFALLLALGLLLTFLCAMLRETLCPDHRNHKNLLGVYANLFRVFTNKTFALSTLSQMFCHLTLFGYIAASPFILQQLYRLTPLQYSLCFAINALALCTGSLLASHFSRCSSSLRLAAIDLIVASLCLTLCLALHLPLPIIMICYIFTLLGFGLIQPGLMTTAMDTERHNAGAASAIYGASAFLAGALVSPLVTLGTIEITSGCVMTLGAALCLVCVRSLCRRLDAIHQ